MARLTMLRNGRQQKEFDLKVGQEYLAGRGENCQIILEAEAGISRQHFKLVFRNGSWEVEVLSRFGEMYVNGEKQKQFSLMNGMEFSVPPYTFSYFQEEDVKTADANVTEILPENSMDNEKTFVGTVPMIGVLKLVNPEGEVVSTHQLSGDNWVVGRDPSCHIFIEHSKISRRQFEVMRQEEDFLIRDLGSSNGTIVNGSNISPDQWTPLHSGDVIALADWTMQFELRDASFEHRVSQHLPAVSQIYHPTHFDPSMASPTPQAAPTFHQMDQKIWKDYLKGKNAIYAAIAVALIGYVVIDTLTGQSKNRGTPSVGLSPFDRLPDEKKIQVKQLFASGFELYKSENYELARSRMVELHQILPSGYENSLELQVFSENALQTIRENEKIRVEEEKKRQIQQMVLETTLKCREKMNSQLATVTRSEMETCLHEALAADPVNNEIQKLLSEVDNHVISRQLQEESQARWKAEMSGQIKRYHLAESLVAQKKYLQAIKTFKGVLGADLPNPNNVKGMAQRQLASIQEKIDSVSKQSQEKAKEEARAGKIKSAVIILRRALANDPENSALKNEMNNYLLELTKQMQKIFEEAHFEESYGEIESAQSKWRKILEMSLPEEEYYGKAKTRLGRYGKI